MLAIQQQALVLLPIDCHLSVAAIFRLPVLRVPQIVGGEAPVEGGTITLQGECALWV